MATPNYDVNYDDERFSQVEEHKDNALTDLEKTYGDMIANSDSYYQKQEQAVKDWEKTQTDLQNQQTQHTINKINQQKDQAHKDYVKEQSGAYTDWRKQSNQYGTEAEKMASSGLANTGYSESSQVGMYNTYQNRVASAREVYNQAVINYDNAIKDAQLQNSTILAELAYNSLQQQLELSLQGFQYKNSLILEQANKKTELENTYYNRYLDVLNQINTENALAENVRQFESTQEFNRTQAQLERDFQAQQAELSRSFQAQQDEINRQHDFAMLDAQTEKEKEMLDKQHQQDLEKLKKQHEYALAELKASYSYKSGSGGGNGGNGGNGGYINVQDNSPGMQWDEQSIKDLGWGNLSAAEVEKLVKEGKVTVTQKGNKLYVKKSTAWQNIERITKTYLGATPNVKWMP